MTRFVGRYHRSNAFHCVSKLATINNFSGKKIQNFGIPRARLSSNESYNQFSEKEELVIKDDSMFKNNKPPKYGNLVTILSLDGGGVRGIIGGVILANLEKHLQVIHKTFH